MTDSKLDELERRWRESGRVEDETRYLLEVARCGGPLTWEAYSRLAELDAGAASTYLGDRLKRCDLEERRLRVAAHCGHEPARLVDGQACRIGVPLEAWVRALLPCGRDVALQVALFVARTVRPACDSVAAAQDQDVPRAGSGGLEIRGVFVSRPFGLEPPPFDVAALAGQAVAGLEELARNDTAPVPTSVVEALAHLRALQFLGAFAAVRGGFSVMSAFDALAAAIEVVTDPEWAAVAVQRTLDTHFGSARSLVPWAMSESTARDALSAALVPWALCAAP